MRKPVIVLLLAALAVGTAGCSASPTPVVKQQPLPTGAPTSAGAFDESLAYQSAWHIEGKGKYFDGATDTCDLNLGISIEDSAALANPDPNTPVFGAVFLGGQISYGTVWASGKPGTGIVSGEGRYAISYDSSGLPTVAHGTATVRWHDAKKKPALSTRTDTLTLTFTREPRAGHCP